MVATNVPLFGTVYTATVLENAVPVTDAAVTMNSIVIPHVGNGTYTSFNVSIISAGTPVTLSVVRGGVNINVTLDMPEQCVVTAPTSGSTHNAANPVTVQWNALASPYCDYIRVSVSENYTASGNEWHTDVFGTATSVNIPGGTLKTNQSGITADVFSVNRTVDLGPQAAALSSYDVVNAASSPPFNTAP